MEAKDPRTCAYCQFAFQEKKPVIRLLSLELCPICQHEASRSEIDSWRNEHAILTSDLSWMYQFLKKLKEQNISYQETVDNNKYLWVLQGATSWECQIIYNKNAAGSFTIFLISRHQPKILLKQIRDLHQFCAKNAVQFYGIDGPSAHYGPQQQVSIQSNLSYEFFAAVIQRLENILQQMLHQYLKD